MERLINTFKFWISTLLPPLKINFERRASKARNPLHLSNFFLFNKSSSFTWRNMHTSFLSLSLFLFSRPPSMHKHNTTHDCCVRREIKNLLSLAFGDLYNRQCLPLFSLSLYLLYTVASLSLSLSINSASQHSFPKGITFSLSLF